MPAKLTDLAIRNARPRNKKYKLAAGNGLTLLVMPNGAKYWRLRYRFAGKAKEVTVGRPYPEFSLRSAQEAASRMRLRLVDGVDPAEALRQKKIDSKQSAEATFSVAANAWYEHRSQVWAVRTKAQVREYLDKDLIPALGKRPLDLISTKELAVFTGDVQKRGAADVAKKMRQWLKSIFAYARAEKMTTNDPVRDLWALVLPSGGHQNYSHLTLEELPEFLRKLDEVDASTLVL
jgi:hypothetical protein